MRQGRQTRFTAVAAPSPWRVSRPGAGVAPRKPSGTTRYIIGVTVVTLSNALRSHLEMVLGGKVVNLIVKHVDLVNDTTLVDVRYQAVDRPGDHRAAAMTEEQLVPASSRFGTVPR